LAATRTESPTPAKPGKTAAARPAASGPVKTAGAGAGGSAARSAGAASHSAHSAEPHDGDAAAAGSAAPGAGKKPSGPSITVTIPLDRLVSAATSSVTRPVRIARRLLPMKHGLPVYLGIGGLAVVGAVEWPVAAAAGAGFAALRRWGPESLRPAVAESAEPTAGGGKKEKAKDEGAARNGVAHAAPAGSDEAAEAKTEG
jgi:hypothetical protein